MSEKSLSTPSSEEYARTLDKFDLIQGNVYKLLEVAHVSAVYGEPVQNGEQTIIPCAEVLAGVGFGFGGGYGSGTQSEGEGETSTAETNTGSGFGGGGGAGGRSFSRPVAVVIASPEGVRVEPVFDLTKIVLAALTAAGFMVGMIARMRRPVKFGEE
jgi:uncharacterized spore protein YtfJ